MSIKKFHVLLVICILTPTLILISATTPPPVPMTKPNCIDHCGNISIPFPFGTTESCSRNSTFLVNCTEIPGIGPQLFFGDTEIEIKNISLDDGQLKMMRYIAKICYGPTGTPTIRQSPLSWLHYIYGVSNTANKFTIIGCDSYGYVSGRRWSNRNYSTGCIATCQGADDLEEGSCMGMGCCQISDIPNDIRTMRLTVRSFNNHTRVMGFNNCTYGFVVEDNAFKFSRENLTNLRDVEKLPVVVDWVIGKETCQSAQKNSTSYACISSDSECFEPTEGEEGYRCRCKKGYEGNPYLSDGLGCRDINECDSAVPPKCMQKCENRPSGNFTCVCPKGYIVDDDKLGCSCPRGYQSDGDLRDGGCIRAELRIYKPVAGAALGIILVLLFSCLLHLLLKRRRSKKMKHMYFLQNGGILLQEKLNYHGTYSID